jgi:hypothetical protein
MILMVPAWEITKMIHSGNELARCLLSYRSCWKRDERRGCKHFNLSTEAVITVSSCELF